MKKLLIMGGGRDANILWMEQVAAALKIDFDAIYINPHPEPLLEWSLSSPDTLLNGQPMAYSAAFMRYDVFSGLFTKSEFANENASNWYAVFAAWCQTNNIRLLNQRIDLVSGSKIAMLLLAQKHGFEIPETYISNSRSFMETLGDPDGYIAKPVSGGTYCVSLSEAIREAEWVDGAGACPAIIQEKLKYPEFRVYRVGARFFAFNIHSETLDSRLDKTGEIVPISIKSFPPEILGSLEKLTDELGCDFCAIDLKTNPHTNQLVFLELNNGPMFVGYDKTLNGAMAREILAYLLKE